MKRQILVVMFLMLVVAVTGLAQATSGFTARAHIPFEFVVQNDTLRAGDYLVQMPSATPSPLMIREAKGIKEQFVLQVPVQEKWSGAPQLTFERIAGVYYLVQVADPRVGVQRVQQSRRYDEARKVAAALTVTVAAK